MSLFTVSFVPFTDELFRNVAARCNVTETRIREYTSSDEQNDEFLRAFLFFGVGPINKVFTGK